MLVRRGPSEGHGDPEFGGRVAVVTRFGLKNFTRSGVRDRGSFSSKEEISVPSVNCEEHHDEHNDTDRLDYGANHEQGG
jgi:hypothetical protein